VIRIGRWTFPTKIAAEDYIREMFWRYPPMGALTGEDLEFAHALVEMHPSRTVIVDCGIRSIHVQPVPYHEEDQRRFLVWRTDSSKQDFSWRNSLSPKSAAQKVASILRHEISPQVREFKKRAFRGLCETCQISLTLKACVIDHAHPATFEQLMEGWLKSEHLTPPDVAIVRPKGYEKHSYMEDPALTQSWVEYHEIHARLRCVCQRCNQSFSKKPKVRAAHEN